MNYETEDCDRLDADSLHDIRNDSNDLATLGELIERSVPMDSKYFAGCLEDVAYACESIKEKGLCEHCPMSATCIDESTFSEIAFDIPRDNFDEIIKMGENPEWYILSDEQKIEIAYRNR